MSVSHASHPIIFIILLKLNPSLHYSNYKSTVTVNWERERETIIAAAEEKREREKIWNNNQLRREVALKDSNCIVLYIPKISNMVGESAYRMVKKTYKEIYLWVVAMEVTICKAFISSCPSSFLRIHIYPMVQPY